jgi:hypothetical protein
MGQEHQNQVLVSVHREIFILIGLDRLCPPAVGGDTSMATSENNPTDTNTLTFVLVRYFSHEQFECTRNHKLSNANTAALSEVSRLSKTNQKIKTKKDIEALSIYLWFVLRISFRKEVKRGEKGSAAIMRLQGKSGRIIEMMKTKGA